MRKYQGPFTASAAHRWEGRSQAQGASADISHMALSDQAGSVGSDVQWATSVTFPSQALALLLF